MEGVDEFLDSFKDLAVGEYVVHVEHGIGVYRGIRKLKVGEYEKTSSSSNIRTMTGFMSR